MGRLLTGLVIVAFLTVSAGGALPHISSNAYVSAATLSPSVTRVAVFRRSTHAPLTFTGDVTLSRTRSPRGFPAIAVRQKGFLLMIDERDVTAVLRYVSGNPVIVPINTIAPESRLTRYPSPSCGVTLVQHRDPTPDCADRCCNGGGGGFDSEPWGDCYQTDCGYNPGGFGEGDIIDVGLGYGCGFFFKYDSFDSCYSVAVSTPQSKNLFISHATQGSQFLNNCTNPSPGTTTMWWSFFIQGSVTAVGSRLVTPSSKTTLQFGAPENAYIPGKPASLDVDAYQMWNPIPLEYLGYCNYTGP